MRRFNHKEERPDPAVEARFEDPVGYLEHLGIDSELVDCIDAPLATAA